MYAEGDGRSGMSGMGMFFIGLLAGAAVGGAVALLIAPRSGKETREMIRGKAMETQQMIKSRANEVKERVSKIGGTMRSRAEQEAQQVTGE
jgi:gas vesicle protein